MNVKTDFEMALIKQEFESSDDKLALWKRVKQQDRELFKLILLAMEFSYEQGQMNYDGEE